MFPLNKDTPKGAYTFHWITPVVTKISYNPFFETAAPHTAAVFLCPELIFINKKPAAAGRQENSVHSLGWFIFMLNKSCLLQNRHFPKHG